MELIQAIVLGIIQGLTEFLPISSTAHLRIVPTLLGWPDPGAAYTAIIQLGTVAAVIIYFRSDLAKAFMAWIYSLTGKKEVDKADARLGWAVFIGTLPIVIAGFLFRHQIKSELRSLYVIAVSLIVMSAVMLAADKMGKRTRKVGDVTIKDGIVVGLWQMLSLVPGASRSGSTISGALFQGFDRVAAARFSFLLSLPSVTAAGLYEAYEAVKGSKSGDPALQLHWGPVILATIVSFVVGYAAIAYFIKFLQKHGIAPFVWYRLALAALILVLLQTGMLKANEGAESSAKTTNAVSMAVTH